MVSTAPGIFATGFLCAMLLPPGAFAQDGGKQGPVTQSLALKLGPEDLTQYTDPSEAGQDHAARLYAAARRTGTEHALALKSVQLVLDLQEWRQALSKCRGDSCALASIVNGGGTMYSHGRARDCAPLEDFLAELATRLPFPEGRGSPKAAGEIDGAVAFIRKLKPFDSGDARANKAVKAELAAEVKRVAEHWEALRHLLSEVPAKEAERIAAFAAESLGWLKEDEAK